MVKRNAQKARINDPYITLALSILYAAKQDAQMWNDCVKEFGEDRNSYNSLDVAYWVMSWIKRHGQQSKEMGIDIDKFIEEKMK